MSAVTPPQAPPCQFAFETDSGVGARAAIGLIVLASDQTIEHEFRLMANLPGVAVYESRIYNANDITPATLRAMEADIARATDLILPGANQINHLTPELRRVRSTCLGHGIHLLRKRGGVHESGSTPL